MSEHNDPLPGNGGSPSERHTALFAALVLQQANMASMFLGQAPRPDQAGKTAVDLGSASLFIDTLEMLEAKTEGHLSKDEARVLRETLTTLRIAFVAAADRPAAAAAPSPQATPPMAESTAAKPPAEGRAAGEEDARKKFVKRY